MTTIPCIICYSDFGLCIQGRILEEGDRMLWFAVFLEGGSTILRNVNMLLGLHAV